MGRWYKMDKVKKWINFARWSDRSNCVGKGRILDVALYEGGLYIDMTLEGVRYTGVLPFYTEEEE